MGNKVWFIVSNNCGRREIITGDIETYKEAVEEWEHLIKTRPCIQICETVYG